VRRFSHSGLASTLKHIGAFEMFVVLSGQPVKGQSFLNVFFLPRAELLISFLPSQKLGRQVSAGFLVRCVDRRASAIQ